MRSDGWARLAGSVTAAHSRPSVGVVRNRDARSRTMTHHIGRMMDTHPSATDRKLFKEQFADCIATCFECAQTCTACADACLAEDMVAELARCIRTDLDCAEICATTGSVLTRQTGTDNDIVRALLEACRTACRACAEECEQHAHMHEHCRVCAEVCRRCESACAELAAAMA